MTAKYELTTGLIAILKKQLKPQIGAKTATTKLKELKMINMR